MIRVGLLLFSLFLVGCGSSRNLQNKLEDVIVFEGDEKTAYRDPAILYNEGVFHLYFTLVEIEADEKIYSYTAYSQSKDLVKWTTPVKITPRDQKLSYSSPGNIIRYKNEWILCLQTYPRPGYTVDQMPRFGDSTARVFIMRSQNLQDWSKPELLKVKGIDVPQNKMGRMIDPYLVEDKDEKGKYWCFYKQNGVSMSWSYDLINWTYTGSTKSGENVCVLKENDEYILFHAPKNGIGIKKSKDLMQWTDWGNSITLDQENWDWAKGRLTAGAVIDMRHTDWKKYLMFFHGSALRNGKRTTSNYSSIGIAWSDDLVNWEWPTKK